MDKTIRGIPRRAIGLCILGIGFLLCGLSLSAQESDREAELSLIDLVSQLAAETAQAVQKEAGEREGETVVSAAGILYRDQKSPLGETFSSQVISRLANLDQENIIPVTRQLSQLLAAGEDSSPDGAQVPAADIIISGIAFEDANEILIDIQLIQRSNHRILAGIERRYPVTPEIRRALAPAGTGGTAAGGDPQEPNNSPDQAASLEPGETLHGLSIHPGGDTDWFLLETEAGGSASDYLLKAETTGTTDTYMYLYGPDSPSQLIMENDDLTGQNAGVSTLLEAGASYYLQVRGYSSSTQGQYGLRTALETAQLDSYEPNNSREQATEFTLSTPPQEHSLSPAGDTDWFRIPLSAEEEPYRLRISTVGSLDTLMELYSQQGTLIQSDDDSGSSSNALIVHTVNQPGEFFVKVSGYDSSEAGNYRFQITREILQTDSFEPDNSRSQATPLELNGKPQARTFSSSEDRDWIRLTLAEAQVVILETTGETDTYMTLFDDQGNTLYQDDDSGSQRNALIQERLPGGTYFLSLSPVDENVTNAQYTLHAGTY